MKRVSRDMIHDILLDRSRVVDHVDRQDLVCRRELTLYAGISTRYRRKMVRLLGFVAFAGSLTPVRTTSGRLCEEDLSPFP